MLELFKAHRDAEAQRDYDAILDTFADSTCYLATAALGTRSVGKEATRAAYVAYFTAFPDLAPEDEGFAYGDDALVSWGRLRGTSGGTWFGVGPSGASFDVPFTNVTTFVDDRMEGETIYFDLATLCDQAKLPLDRIRAAAAAAAAAKARTARAPS